MRQIILLLALFACACRAHGPEVKLGPGADLQRYRRIGVLPFREAKGDGRASAELMEQAFARLGLAIVDSAQLSRVFRELKIEPGSEISMHQLFDVRKATQADALVFGTVSPAKDAKKRPRLKILIVDGESGDLVAEADVEIPTDEQGGLGAATDGAIAAVRREIDRRQTKQGDLSLEDM